MVIMGISVKVIYGIIPILFLGHLFGFLLTINLFKGNNNIIKNKEKLNQN